MITVSDVKNRMQLDSSVSENLIESVFILARNAMRRKCSKSYADYTAMTSGDIYDELKVAETYYAMAELVTLLPQFSVGMVIEQNSQFGEGKTEGKSLDEIARNTAEVWAKKADTIISYWLSTKDEANPIVGNSNFSVGVI